MATEELNNSSRVFRARLEDGSQVTYKAMWQGYVDLDTREDGRPSTWDHPFDDRRCHWSANGRIVRSVAVVIAGQEYWNDSLTTAFSQGQQGIGSGLVLTELRPENCNDCRDRRESDFADMRNRVNGALAGIVEADLPEVLEGIRGLPGIVEVNLPA
ncbi:MAG TPA: hypothetical protein VGA98_06555 [Allosphingosinicella sp.]|jgi:hypothetical protein